MKSPDNALRCQRDGCTGTVEDGFCLDCGLAPAAAPSATAGPAASAAPAASGTSGAAQPAAGPDGPGTGTMPWQSTATRGSRRTSTTRTTRRGQLGIGLVEVPRVPYRDPSTAVLDNPQVAEHKRFCSKCGEPVGRGRDAQPGRTEGFCTRCGANFSFTPKLTAGDVVAGQYVVLGCLAHGGLGWIYLARDRNVSDRWVVLKGLLDAGDADAMAAAVAERRFLAEVEHPNIVRIYNFVQHVDPTSNDPVGYIVMEYVGGQSLRDMLRARRADDGAAAALPLPQVIAYGVEALRALGYLHSVGLVFCDFKPDNVIQTEELVKLIDLGAVRKLDDDEGSIWGTVGYQAPEIAVDGPSVSSDIYTVGRSLAVLSFSFDFASRYLDRLPDAGEVPVLAQHPSYSRLLLRATDQNPDARFESAEQMSGQLAGVLREVLAAEDGQPRPAASTLFTVEQRTFGADLLRDPAAAEPTAVPDPAELVTALPVPQVDADDPAAGLLATLSGTGAGQGLVDALTEAAGNAGMADSVEVRLRLVREYVELGLAGAGTSAGPGWLGKADKALARLADEEPHNWQVRWYRGLAALAGGRPADAATAFDQVYNAVPGEAAPKLALAACAECTGDLPTAARYYLAVWRTDHSYVSAAFGLARVQLRQDDRAGAIAVLDAVPATSSHYLPAQAFAVLAGTFGEVGKLAGPDLAAAGTRLAKLDLDAQRTSQLAVRVLSTALDWVRTGGAGPRSGATNGTVLDCAFTDRDLRLGLEQRLRTLARLAEHIDHRIALVDRANAIRPRTLV